MRIFYLCPDFTAPSGGVKRLYTHVEILRANGYEAYILHFNRPFKPAWFENDVPIVYSSDSPSMTPKDTVVIPEGFPNIMKQLTAMHIRKVVIALNPLYIFRNLPMGESWIQYGIHWVMTNTRTMGDFITWSMGIEHVHLIGTSLDHSLFYYEPREKHHQVAYLKRKDTASEMVEKILKSRERSLRDLEFIPIENLKIEDYARVLRESEIYLNTCTAEGFPRSTMEAMASGCFCAGYHGIGGLDYFVDDGERQNFILAEAADFVDLSKKLVRLLEMVRARDPLLDRIRHNALATAAQFTPELEKESIIDFWRTYFSLL